MEVKDFVLGICFGTIGLSVLSTISDIIVNKAELAKAKICVEITKCNSKINKISTPTETRAIGFATSNVEEDDYEE